eukprot:scaffold7446_cov126-Isochrysis_galbana.AAC.1
MWPPNPLEALKPARAATAAEHPLAPGARSAVAERHLAAARGARRRQRRQGQRVGAAGRRPAARRRGARRAVGCAGGEVDAGIPSLRRSRGSRCRPSLGRG